MKAKQNGGRIIDASAFKNEYLSKEAMDNYLQPLTDEKVDDLKTLIKCLQNGTKIILKPSKRLAENGEYSYNSIEVKGKNGILPFFVSHHPDLERFILDYLYGSIKVSFSFDEL